MSKRFFTILNGSAGGGRCKPRAEQALKELRGAGLEFDVHLTERIGHATEIAERAYADGERQFLSIGGDGTSFEIVNGLFKNGTPEEVSLGILPLGTGNSFLRDFNIESVDDAMEALKSNRTQSIDVVHAEHAEGSLHFINTMGIGFVAKVGELTNKHFKALGAGGYVAAVLASVVTLDYPADAIKLGGGSSIDSEPATLLSFSNSKYTGGAMKMAPSASVQDGRLDVIRVGKLGRMGLVTTFPKIFAGTHTRHPLIDEFQTNRVDFVDARKQPVLIDGELMHLKLRSLSVLPNALRVFA